MPKQRTQPRILYSGKAFEPFAYFFHRALEVSWPLFLFCAFLIFLTVNSVFALFYQLTQGLTNTVNPGTLVQFSDSLYFSMTFPVVGFGGLAPVAGGRIISALQVFIGLLFLSALTGLIFARFSRGRSPLVWSGPVVINTGPDGLRQVQVRVTNVLGNDVVNVSASLFLQRIEQDTQGETVRRLVPMALEISQIPIAALSWVLTHRVDQNSPLSSWIDGVSGDHERLVGFLYGYDSTLGKDIYVYSRWKPSELVQGRFAKVITDYRELGDLQVHVKMDLSRMDEVIRED